jgi:hypothetical protein
MLSFTTHQWVLVVLLVACYLAICVRTAMRMARTGRSFWKWLVISVLLTSLPASLVLVREQVAAIRAPRRSARAGRPAPPPEPADTPPDQAPIDEEPSKEDKLIRCAQCGKRIRPADVDRTGGLPACPSCHLPIDEEKLA